MLCSMKSELKKLFFVNHAELELWSWNVRPFAWPKKIKDQELLLSFLKPKKGPQETLWNTFPFWHWFYSFRRCSTCKKKRSLRTTVFFAKWPKIPLGELLMMIYFWAMDQTRISTARMMSINNNLVCTVFHSLEDACAADIVTNPVTPLEEQLSWSATRANSITKQRLVCVNAVVTRLLFFQIWLNSLTTSFTVKHLLLY